VIAMVTSFFQSVLLLQPIKVVLAAVVFALIIKKPNDSEEESNALPLVERKMKKDKAPKKMKKYYRYCQINKQTKTYHHLHNHCHQKGSTTTNSIITIIL
jgi:ligand-binding sensor protein